MPIFLSASAIKDFLSCSKRYEYRRFAKQKSIETEAMAIGTVVHDVLEHCWDKSEFEITDYAKALSQEKEFSEKALAKVLSLSSSYINLRGSIKLSERDVVEEFFKVPYTKNVFIVGKFDRVLEESVLIDWKTGSVPMSLSYDPQFVLYDWAFEKVFGHKASSLMAVSLASNKFVKYIRRQVAVESLVNEIIPHILRRIETGEYFLEGRFSFLSTCKNCTFLRHCNDELASRNLTKRTI